MRVDYSISCDSGTHKMYVALAWLIFFLIPVGFPLTMLGIFKVRCDTGCSHIVYPTLLTHTLCSRWASH